MANLGSGVLGLLPPQLLAAPPARWQDSEELKRPWLGVSTALPQLKHRGVIKAVLILNPKHSTVTAARGKINSTGVSSPVVTPVTWWDQRPPLQAASSGVAELPALPRRAARLSVAQMC